MSRELRRLLAAETLRSGWIWAGMVAFQLLMLLGVFLDRRGAPVIMSINAILFPVTLFRRPARFRRDVVWLLPLSLNELGTAHWCFTIGFRGLVLTGSLLALAALGLGPQVVGQQLLGVWGLLGVISGTELLKGRSWIAASGLSMAAVAIVIGAYRYAPAMGLAAFIATAAAIGLPAMGYLWLRREKLMLWQQASDRVEQRGLPGRAQPFLSALLDPPWVGPALRFGRSLLAWLLVGGATGAALTLAVAEPKARDLTLILFGGAGLALLSTRLLYYRSALRFFRSLPLTAERAAAILFLMAAAPSAPLVLGMLAACRALAAPAAAFPHSNTVVPVMIFLVSCQILLLPLGLGAGSFGTRVGGVLLLLLAAVGGGVSFFDTQITNGGALMGCALAFAGISAAASYLWIRHELRIGGDLYRAPPAVSL